VVLPLLVTIVAATAGIATPRAASAVTRPIVVLYGDSLSEEAAGPFTTGLEEHATVVIRAMGGLAICDELDQMATDLDVLHPTAVVVQFSGNAYTPCMALHPYPTDGYYAAYHADADEVMAVYADTDVLVWWVSAPIPRWVTDAARWQTLNRMYSAMPLHHPNARFIDAGAAVLRAGAYTDSLPCLFFEPCEGLIDAVTGELANRVRSPDGTHFCPVTISSDDGRCPVWSSGAWRFGIGMAAPVADWLTGTAPRVVAGVVHGHGDGLWLLTRDGDVVGIGATAPQGSVTGWHTDPFVGVAATPSGAGYWLVASDGGIFAFGDATFHGSTGNTRLNQPIVGMAATPTGAGYWLVASDGGIFAFGDGER
jgi:hypothetical protein